MNRFKDQLIFVLLLLLTACATAQAPSLAAPAAPAATLSQSTPSPINLPTQTLQVSPAPDHRSAATIHLPMIPLEKTGMDGFLVLGTSSPDNLSIHYSLYDLANKKNIDISINNEPISILAVSPNRKLLLAGNCLKDKCAYLLRDSGKIIKSHIPTNNDWVVTRWLDNERVAFVHKIRPNPASQPQEVVIYNVFSNEKSILMLDLPIRYTYKNTGGPDNLLRASLASTLKRLVYSDLDDRLVLWNMETQKEMASLPHADAVSQIGADGWSPDGDRFVTTSPNVSETTENGLVPSPNELFMFDMAGNSLQLTHFNQDYVFAQFTSPAWNPDNRQIAVWLWTSADNSKTASLQQNLAIIDTQTRKSTIYPVAIDNRSAAIWSPDGQKLLACDLDGSCVLIDVVKNTQSRLNLAGKTFVADWLAP